MTGIRPSNLIGSPHAYFHPEDRDAAAKAREYYIHEDGPNHPRGWRIIGDDGKLRIVRISVAENHAQKDRMTL